ncbi:Metallo-dependent Hydrolase/TatD-type [Abortiporus biennis]
MATRRSDQILVRELAQSYPDKVTSCFGYHPWFTHWITLDANISKEYHYRTLLLDNVNPKSEHVEAFEKLLTYLPEPTSLPEVLSDLRNNLSFFPDAMLGEVGIDRSARIPYSHPAPPPYSLHDDGTRKDLSPFTIPIDHQLVILEAQLDLAVELQRNVSIHSVKSQQATVELLDKMKKKHESQWESISIDMHSCGLSVETWKTIQKKHSNVFLSLSTAINSRSPAHRNLISACSPHRILVESDFHDVRYSTQQTWEMLRIIAEVHRWKIEDNWMYSHDDADREDDWGAVRRLEENWKRFQQGGHNRSEFVKPKNHMK